MTSDGPAQRKAALCCPEKSRGLGYPPREEGPEGSARGQRDAAVEGARGRRGLRVEGVTGCQRKMPPGKRRAKAWMPLPASRHVGDGGEAGVKDPGFRALSSGN